MPTLRYPEPNLPEGFEPLSAAMVTPPPLPSIEAIRVARLQPGDTIIVILGVVEGRHQPVPCASGGVRCLTPTPSNDGSQIPGRAATSLDPIISAPPGRGTHNAGGGGDAGE